MRIVKDSEDNKCVALEGWKDVVLYYGILIAIAIYPAVLVQPYLMRLFDWIAS